MNICFIKLFFLNRFLKLNGRKSQFFYVIPYFIFIWVVLNNNYINKKLIKIKILCMNFIFKNIYKIFLKHYNSNGHLFRKIVFFKTDF